MATKLKNLSKYDEKNLSLKADAVIGIIVSDWNEKITHSLFDACQETLLKHGLKEENLHTIQVPGAFELPKGAKILMTNESVDAVICLGCVITGETKHDQYISQSVANGIMNLNVVSSKPVIFGVLTPNDEQQAKDRAGGKHGNKGVEAAVTAIHMVNLKDQIGKGERKIGF